jgi:ATP-dependent phosphofructokinase / diphosphate-dependent phosphofructokinase
MMIKKIGILTGGGDVPGLNPCMKTVVMQALEYGYEVLGIRRGWAGLLHYDFDEPSTHEYYVRKLDKLIVRTIDRSGGTFLHTSRTNPQKVRSRDVPDFLKELSFGKAIDKDGTMDYTDYILQVLSRLGIDALVSIGGDDTLSFSARLNKEGFPIIGIPKTMDNDVNGTDYCIGFSTAVTRSVNMITDFRTPLGSHERIGVVELFGRNSGETSLISAYLASVDRVLISEVPFNMNKLAELLVEDKRNNPSNYALMTVSEGATMIGGEIIEKGDEDAYGHRKLGGIGEIICEEIKKLTGQHTMYQKLGYLMRSGPPDSLDRMVASGFGHLAASLVNKKDFGKMVGLKDGKYSTVPIDTVISGKRTVNVDKFYDKENYRVKVRDFMNAPMFLE